MNHMLACFTKKLVINKHYLSGYQIAFSPLLYEERLWMLDVSDSQVTFGFSWCEPQYEHKIGSATLFKTGGVQVFILGKFNP